jgi:hypothetical protein
MLTSHERARTTPNRSEEGTTTMTRGCPRANIPQMTTEVLQAKRAALSGEHAGTHKRTKGCRYV